MEKVQACTFPLLSVDSIGEMNDYIRRSEWEHTVKQFHLLDNTGPNVEVTVACAVQALNIYYLPDFVKWKIEQNFKKINFKIIRCRYD